MNNFEEKKPNLLNLLFKVLILGKVSKEELGSGNVSISPKKFFRGFLLGIIIFLIAGFAVPANPFSKEESVFNAERGQGSKEISANLENQGIIYWGPMFRAYVLLSGSSKKMQAGNYSLSPSMNIFKIAQKMRKGEVIKENVVLIEGWSLKDMDSYLAEKGIFGLGEFLAAASSSADYSGYDFLKDKPRNMSLEGYLFPDTYQINMGSDAKDLVSKMLANFDKKLTPDLRAEIDRQGKTIFEVMTMASLIEKEVMTKEDKEMVSGIFWKRLGVGMPLNSCATIAYVLGVDKWRYSYEDTRIPSPYNTYLNAGLPLGPICNPGLESIKAAVYPKTSAFWFYLSTPEGETIYSRNLEEHNIAKAKYLK
jgi:UPF0755 protein